jgi:hypothetical protein
MNTSQRVIKPMIHTVQRPIILVAAAITTILTGCATGPAFQSPDSVPPDRSQLYIYRPLVLAGGGVVHKITIDGGTDALSLPNASWQRVELAPGPHTVSIKDYFGLTPCGAVTIELSAGQSVYLANVVKTTPGLGALYVSCTVVKKPTHEALKELMGLSRAS